jgi:4-hydroxy-tetrahydrodipicolinate synthase
LIPQLRGVFAPIVTPFRPEDGEVNMLWIARHLEYLQTHGCDGVIACGTNGEAASMSVSERQAVLEKTLEAAGKLQVIAGTGAAALPDAITLTRHAFASGVSTVLVMPPFYFKHPPEAGVVAWFQRLCDAAVPPGGRVLLYHIPQTTAVPFTDSLIHALLETLGSVICGIKDSTGDPEHGSHLRSTFPHLAYFVGNDHLVASACLEKGSGSITAGANVFPDLVARVKSAAWTGGDWAAAQETLSAARRLLETYPLQAATKVALSYVAKLPPLAVRPPQAELTAAQSADLCARLQTYLQQWRPIVSRESLA